MAKFALIYKTIADNGSITSTGVNVWSSELPLGFMQDRMLNRTARAINLGTGNQTVEFLIDLGEYLPTDLSTYKPYDSINLINHSISPKGTISVSIGNDPASLTAVNREDILAEQADGNFLKDQTANLSFSAYLQTLQTSYVLRDDEVYKAIVGEQDWKWGSPNWFSRRLTELDLYGFTRVCSINLPMSLDNTARGVQSSNGRFIKITITDTFPSSLREYIDIGRLFIGTKFSPEYCDTMTGTSIQYNDKSVVEESINGENFYSKRSVKRQMDFTFAKLTKNEVYNGILDIQRQSGVTGEILVIPNTDDTAYGFKRNFLGKFKTLNGVGRKTTDVFTNTLSIEEIL